MTDSGSFRTASAYLLDLDGTLYSGGLAIPGAVEAIQRLRQRGVPYRLVTNTTSRSRSMLADRLRGYGFDASQEEIFTATIAGARLAQRSGLVRIAPFTPEAALEDMAGLDLAGGTSGRPAVSQPDAVMIGDLGDRWNYQLLQEAFEYLMNGAELIALSRDRYWLRNDKLALDAGPFVVALEFAGGRAARIAGKPSPDFYREALASLGLTPSREAAMVGDDLWSDVEGAQQAGLQGWLVRTGKFRDRVLRDSGIHPDRILASVALLD